MVSGRGIAIKIAFSVCFFCLGEMSYRLTQCAAGINSSLLVVLFLWSMRKNQGWKIGVKNYNF